MPVLLERCLLGTTAMKRLRIASCKEIVMQQGSRKDLKYPRVCHPILSTCHIRSRMLAEISTFVFPQSTELMAIE